MTAPTRRTGPDEATDPSSRRATRRLEVVPALDGFRGLAVVLVMLVHVQLLVPWEQTGIGVLDGLLRGGFLGVDLFFVLSGFLITALLLNELDRRRRVGYRGFYVRRGLRLLPALYVFLLAHLAYALTAGLDMSREWPSQLAAIFYVTNWQVVVAPDSLAHHFTHLWSLSIEEQFYLLWPATLVGYLGLRRDARQVGVVLGGAVVAVVAWRAWLFADPQIFWPEIVVRTDTRLDALLIGALLASLWVRRATPTRGLGPAAGVASVVLVACLIGFDGPDEIIYQGGLTVVAAAAAVIVLALVEGSWSGRHFFEWRPLRAVGRVSYGVYIWHYPIFFAVGERGADLSNLTRIALALALTAVAVAASWFLVERPALALKKDWARPGGADTTAAPVGPVAARAGVIALCALGAGALVGVLVGDAGADDGLSFPTGDADRRDYWAFADLDPLARDTFGGDPGALADSAEQGGEWSTLGTWTIEDGQASAAVGDGDVAVAAIATSAASADGLVEATLPVVAPGAGIAFRYQDPENHWSVIVDEAGSGWLVERTIDGSTETVAAVPARPENGVTVSVTANDLTFRVLFDGVERYTTLDETLVDTLGGGLIARSAASESARWDRFLLMEPRPSVSAG